jgi:hypothetical protein
MTPLCSIMALYRASRVRDTPRPPATPLKRGSGLPAPPRNPLSRGYLPPRQLHGGMPRSGGVCFRQELMTSCIVCALLAGVPAVAQQRQYIDRNGVPTWPVDPAFKHDVFTFARVQYSSFGGRGGWGWGGRGGGRWATDYPDAELNLAFRLQQMTSLKVNPDAVVVVLAKDDIAQYPFIYIVEPGRLVFSDDEVIALRRYLLNGGFLMVDDFWGEEEWDNFHREIKRVFPDREPVELGLEHPIFRCVFDLKEKPQVPSIGMALRGREYGITWEREDAREPHYRAIFDDKGRMMAIICHNTDLGDGWEREGESEWYFREFAEKKAYPMAINIIFWAMTH